MVTTADGLQPIWRLRDCLAMAAKTPALGPVSAHGPLPRPRAAAVQQFRAIARLDGVCVRPTGDGRSIG